MSIGLAKDNLINSLADSSAFQTFVGAATATQARARVHKSALPPPRDGDKFALEELQTLRPYALVWSTAYHRGHDGSGGGFEFDAGDGALSILVEEDVAVEIADNPAEIENRFEAHLDAIIADLIAVAGSAGYLAIEDLSITDEYARTHPDLVHTYGDVIATVIDVKWGSGGE